MPDCDLRNFGANGECGPIDNINFGRSNPSAVRFADDMIHGYGKRDYLWDFGAEVQHGGPCMVNGKGGEDERRHRERSLDSDTARIIANPPSRCAPARRPRRDGRFCRSRRPAQAPRASRAQR